jgi:CDP-diacylglycerol--glycerol-3-phosphate 3-phosphatidyltransferase
MTISTAGLEGGAPPPRKRDAAWPMALTVARIACGPIVAGLILAADNRVFTHGAEGAGIIWAWAAGLFVLAALTDAVDGPLARRLDAVTPLGAALDHAGDKVLLACTLVALAATALPRELAFAAILLIGRDLLIGGVREGMAQDGASMPVGQLGKIKTALAFAGAGAALLLQPLALAQVAVEALPALTAISRFALWGAVIVAVVSAWVYLRNVARR